MDLALTDHHRPDDNSARSNTAADDPGLRRRGTSPRPSGRDVLVPEPAKRTPPTWNGRRIRPRGPRPDGMRQPGPGARRFVRVDGEPRRRDGRHAPARLSYREQVRVPDAERWRRLARSRGPGRQHPGHEAIGVFRHFLGPCGAGRVGRVRDSGVACHCPVAHAASCGARAALRASLALLRMPVRARPSFGSGLHLVPCAVMIAVWGEGTFPTNSGRYWSRCCRSRCWAGPAVSRRRLIDGIRWRVRTGAPWRDLPSEYGPWQTVSGLFRRWQRDGTWTKLLTRLQAQADAAGQITREVNVDSTICGAHQHAAGARRDGKAQNEPSGGTRDEPEDHGLGRSRGGFTTKIHLACEQGQRPLSSLVTAGQRGNSPQFAAVLSAIRVPRTGPGRLRVRPLRVRGDKAYSSRTNLIYLRKRGIRCTIPEPADQAANRKPRGKAGGRPLAFDREDYKADTRSSAGATGSSATGRAPPGSTNSLSDSRPPS